MKAIHLKIYCNRCGKMLLHERRDLPEPDITPDEVKNPLRAYIGLTVDPCEDCLATLLIEKDVGN